MLVQDLSPALQVGACLGPRAARQTSPGTMGCAPDSAPVVPSPPPAQTASPDAAAPQSLASSPAPVPLPPSAAPIHPPASPACSQKNRSGFRSPLALGSPPASQSPRPAAHSTSPTTPPTPSATSYIRWFRGVRSAPSAPPSASRPTQTPPLIRHGPVAPAEDDR